MVEKPGLGLASSGVSDLRLEQVAIRFANLKEVFQRFRQLGFAILCFCCNVKSDAGANRNSKCGPGGRAVPILL